MTTNGLTPQGTPENLGQPSVSTNVQGATSLSLDPSIDPTSMIILAFNKAMNATMQYVRHTIENMPAMTWAEECQQQQPGSVEPTPGTVDRNDLPTAAAHFLDIATAGDPDGLPLARRMAYAAIDREIYKRAAEQSSLSIQIEDLTAEAS